MAKIHLRTRRESIDINEERAKTLKADWLANDLPDKVDLGGEVFLSKDIKGISIGKGVEYGGSRYNLDNSEDRDIIKQFEKDFLSWSDNRIESEEPPFKCELWFEELGAIRIIKNTKTGYIVVKDPKLYGELIEKWGALQLLKIRREKAKSIEEEILSNLVEN